MKKEMMILTCALAVAAFVGCRQGERGTVNEPAGASRTSTNTLDMSRTTGVYQGSSSQGATSGTSLTEPSGAQRGSSSTNSSSGTSSGGTSGSSGSSSSGSSSSGSQSNP